MYYNYKHFFSSLLLAVCDSDYKFLYNSVGSPRKEADFTIFKSNELFRQLTSKKIKLPPPSTLSPERPGKASCVFVANEEFALSKFLLRPYGGNFLTVDKKSIQLSFYTS